MSPAGVAWSFVAGGVVSYNVLCPHGETLSEGVDRGILHSPIVSRLAVAVIAAHVANVLPARIDPISMLFSAVPRRH